MYCLIYLEIRFLVLGLTLAGTVAPPKTSSAFMIVPGDRRGWYRPR